MQTSAARRSLRAPCHTGAGEVELVNIYPYLLFVAGEAEGGWAPGRRGTGEEIDVERALGKVSPAAAQPSAQPRGASPLRERVPVSPRVRVSLTASHRANQRV